jgi:hypothetical protein
MKTCTNQNKTSEELKYGKNKLFYLCTRKLPQRIANVVLENLAIDREEIYIPFKVFQFVSS